jgi:hypothetical protein
VDRRLRGEHCLHHQGDVTTLHGAISQKALTFILAAVRTWNLTKYYFVLWATSVAQSSL